MPPTNDAESKLLINTDNSEISSEKNPYPLKMDNNSPSSSSPTSKSSTQTTEQLHQAKLFYKQNQAVPFSQKLKTHSIATAVYLGMSSLSAGILTSRWIKEKLTCSSSPSTDQVIFQGKSRVRDMNFVDCAVLKSSDDATKKREKHQEIKKLISNHEPVILRNLDKSLFGKIHKNYSLPEEFEGQYTEGKYRKFLKKTSFYKVMSLWKC